MQLSNTLFDIIELKLILPLSDVYFFLEKCNFIQKLLPLVLMITILLSYPLKKLGYFVVLEPNHLSKAVQFNIEQLILVIYAFLQILQLKVKNLFKLVPQSVQLLAFLPIRLVRSNSLFFYKFLKPFYFLVLLCAHLLNSTSYYRFNILLL